MPKTSRDDTKRVAHKHAPQWGTDDYGRPVLVVLPDKHYKGGHVGTRDHSIHKPDTKISKDELYEIISNA